MAQIKADVALLPVGGKFTMNAHEAAEAANLIQPKVAVPMHWGGIIGSRADADTFRSESQVPVAILEPSA
jgi:L-ascorbate metabolism protein UlaG (beta-lactamase superfamily)